MFVLTTPSELFSKLFDMTPGTAQQYICAFHTALSLGSSTALKIKSDLKPVPDEAHTPIMFTGECDCSFSSMNDVFTPTRNFLLKTVFLRNSNPPPQHFCPELDWERKASC
jgi:hypothetical protein